MTTTSRNLCYPCLIRTQTRQHVLLTGWSLHNHLCDECGFTNRQTITVKPKEAIMACHCASQGRCSYCRERGYAPMSDTAVTSDTKFLVYHGGCYVTPFQDEPSAKKYAEDKARETKKPVFMAKVTGSVSIEQAPVRWTKVK